MHSHDPATCSVDAADGRYRLAQRVGELEAHANAVVWGFDALPDEVHDQLEDSYSGEWFLRHLEELRSSMETGQAWSDWRAAAGRG